MDAKLVVILVLGLAIIGLVGYYLLVVVPQQQLVYYQLQQQAQAAQVQTAIQYCASINQQYDFGSGQCVAPPIQVQVSNWVSALVQPTLASLDRTFNPFNPQSLVSQTFAKAVSYLNPFSQNNLWGNLWSSFTSTLFGSGG